MAAAQSYRFAASLSDEGRYRLLIDAIKDYAIYMLDPEGRVSSWNPGAERFKGYTADEIMGENFSRFYTPEDRESGLPAINLRRAFTEGRYEGEGWRIRKDGGRFWAHVIIDPILDPQGELVGYAKITRDLTERKKTEEELERTREALFQSQKLEAIGQLTGGVAHDFNNLLTVILASLELMSKRMPEDPRIRPLLDNAIQAANRGASLTQRMLAFARRQDLKPAAADIADIVKGMAGHLLSSLSPTIRVEPRLPLSRPTGFNVHNKPATGAPNPVAQAPDALRVG